MNLHAAASLLDEFRNLPARIERPQTFMEIAGYPHYENVCSNFLAFFFDPEGPHGLGSLFLDALTNSVSTAGAEKGFGANVSVEREVVTEAGNRIDILIKWDSSMILIENKIYAAVVNPFNDYAAYLERLKDDNGITYNNKTKVLLTLYPSSEGVEQGFVNLIYADLVNAIRAALGQYISEADMHHLILMLDFLNTLEKLGEGTRMNQEYIKLLAERSDDVEKFLKEVNEVHAELRGKVQELEALLDLDGHQNVVHIPWKPDVSLVHFLQTRVHTDEKSFIGVQTGISPSGWEIQIFSRGRGAPKGPNLEDLLRKLDIMLERDRRYMYPDHFDYNADVSRVALIVWEIVDKISRAVR